MKRKHVYVAGPYSSDPVAGTQAAVEAGDRLWERGYIPFIPHLTHLWHLISPHDYEMWMLYDSYWVAKCDILVRLAGRSAGADREVAQALGLDIPVMTLEEALHET